MSHFYLMVGIPGSGKSTEAQQLADRESAVLVSTDRLREQLTGDAADRSKDGAVFSLASRSIKEALHKAKDVVYDATNLTRSERKRILKALPPEARKICVYLKTPAHVAKERNLSRARVVPEEVISRMSGKLQEPELSEGWDEIRVIPH